MCIDYRRLNAVTEVEAYPMPRVDELIDRLGKARFISTLDLTKGYWQMPVAAQDRHKAALVTPGGLFQFRVMPFDLSGAPASFQRLMDQLMPFGLSRAPASFQRLMDQLIVFVRVCCGLSR